jgi:hypothetical protein
MNLAKPSNADPRKKKNRNTIANLAQNLGIRSTSRVEGRGNKKGDVSVYSTPHRTYNNNNNNSKYQNKKDQSRRESERQRSSKAINSMTLPYISVRKWKSVKGGVYRNA